MLDNTQNDDSATTTEPSPKRKRKSGRPICMNYFPFCEALKFEVDICKNMNWYTKLFSWFKWWKTLNVLFFNKIVLVILKR